MYISEKRRENTQLQMPEKRLYWVQLLIWRGLIDNLIHHFILYIKIQIIIYESFEVFVGFDLFPHLTPFQNIVRLFSLHFDHPVFLVILHWKLFGFDILEPFFFKLIHLYILTLVHLSVRKLHKVEMNRIKLIEEKVEIVNFHGSFFHSLFSKFSVFHVVETHILGNSDKLSHRLGNVL